MLSLTAKGTFKLHSLEVLPADIDKGQVDKKNSSQMEAIKEMLQAARTGLVFISCSRRQQPVK